MPVHPDFPQLPSSRLLYLRDPQRLAVAGRQLGPRWSFAHPYLGCIPVVSARELAEDVFDARLPLLGADRFTDWIGLSNPTRPVPDEVRHAAMSCVGRMISAADPNYHAKRALQPIVDRPGDVGPALRAAALDWMLNAICQADQQRVRAALAAAITWQRSTQTIPLLVPGLRKWSGRADEVAPAKLRLLAALSDCRPRAELDGPHGSYLVGVLLTLLGPVVDALPMIAMSAMTFREAHFARRIERALATAHPVPLLVLEANRYIKRLGRTGLMLDSPEDDWGHLCPGGHYVAVDLAGSGLPFGVGPSSVTLQVLVRLFVTAVLGAASELDLVPLEAPRNARVRLCFGATRLRMAKWPG